MINIHGQEVKIINEREYRSRLMREAEIKGCKIELQHIFDKFDKLLKNCTNKQEAEHIGMLGVLEVSELLDSKNVGKGGALIVNGQKIVVNE